MSLNKVKNPLTIRCIFCDKGIIQTFFYPENKKDNLTTTVGGKKFKSSNVSCEKFEVVNSCNICGASASKIEKSLNSGKDYKTPSRKKALERMRKAGLPTRI
jgi:hypothetical protein